MVVLLTLHSPSPSGAWTPRTGTGPVPGASTSPEQRRLSSEKVREEGMEERRGHSGLLAS
jgi:hypothetical protein